MEYREKLNNPMKAFNIRMPKEQWVFLKSLAMKQELTMNDILLRCIKKLEDKHKN